MILAAGKGERMMPLTKMVPKPLLNVAEKPLIQYHIEALADGAVDQILINTGRMGGQIERIIGDGKRFGVRIRYSHEGNEPLGTGGGVQKVLPLLGEEPFILINADIWTDFTYSKLSVRGKDLAHIVLVDNPGHNPEGDFALISDRVGRIGKRRLTYSGIGLYRPEFFRTADSPMFSFIPELRLQADLGRVGGDYYTGSWYDIGTPERLRELNARLTY
jgi:MurNAc alpha-1-phosphate uridylyltransferase